MARNRVLSFVSQFSGAVRDSRTPTPTSSSPPNDATSYRPAKADSSIPPLQTSLGQHFAPDSSTLSPTPVSPVRAEFTPSPLSMNHSPGPGSPQSRKRSNSRPLSMVQAYNPPIMDVNEDTIPELQPIFTFLNNHANKLYQEGYFLKLDDQNTQGRPNPDRTWTECFAQLVGTVLSLWDAAELDAAGEHGEVLPKFINLTDASIKMIESLPTKSNDEQPLQNILSISTAGRNRYLLHFNSHHSLIQWTAGIRLSMFEHSTLQEAYTGALIAGKGKTLNNIHIIMDRAKVKTEDWVRVRFGAGVPWRRCWCVISPPDEKEYQKQQKEMRKRSPYDRSHIPNLKGDIKFYDTRIQGKKQKKAKPIASIADAFSAYAIYPQAKSLIDASTLIKIEGNITIHSDPPSSTEGFVFIMPEVHPAVTGFEMLLRYLFPTWDTFGLYGRPGRLVASVLDPRSLMFGMPKHKKYGYLEILDVNSLILTEGSTSWSEREWRRRLKELTGARMTAMEEDPKGHSRTASRRSARLSIGPGSGAPPSRPRVNFADDSSSVRSSRSLTGTHPGARTDSAPPAADRRRGSPPYTSGHARNSSDTPIDGPLPFRGPPGFDSDSASPSPVRGQNPQGRPFVNDLASTPERVSSEDERSPQHPPPRDFGNMERMQTPEPVHAPPAFSHGPSSRPAGKPYHSPELRRANSRLSSTTLAQLAKAGGVPASMDYYRDEQGRMSSEDSSGSRPGQGDSRGQGVAIPTHAAHASPLGMNANGNGSREVLNHPSGPPGTSPGLPVPANPSSQRSRSPLNQMSNSDPRGPSPSTFAHPPSGPYNPYQQPQQQQQMLPPQGPPPGGPLPPGPPSSHAGMSGPVGRKPLPQPQRQESDPASEYKLDNRGLAQVRPPGPDQRFTPPPNARGPHRQGTQTSDGSHYDDGSSTTTPDYASTRSADTQESIERPRAGVLKTVGDDSQSQNANRDPHAEYGIPEIDFGRTVNYGASASAIPRNKTPTLLADGGRTLTLGNTHSRQESDDTIRRNVAWQPSGAGAVSPDDRSGALSPEQYVQQRAAAAAAMPHYTHARSPSGNTLAGSRNNTPTPPLMKRRSSFDMLNPKGLHSRSNSADLLGQRPSSQGAPSALGMAGSGDISSQLSAREQEHVARITGGPLISMAGNRDAPQNAGLVGAIGAREREKQQIKQGVSSALVENAISHRQQMQEREYRQQQQQHHQFMQPQRPQQQQQPMYGMAAPMGPPSGAPSMFGGSQGMRMGGGPMGGQIGGPMGGPMPMGSPGGGGRGYMPGPGYGPPQGRPSPQMHSPHGSPHPGAHVYAQGGGFSRPWPRQGGGGPPQQGMPPQGIPPQVMQQQHYQQGPPQGFGPGGFIPPPQGQRSPGPRVGTPNGMARGAPPPYQGQAF